MSTIRNVAKYGSAVAVTGMFTAATAEAHRRRGEEPKPPSVRNIALVTVLLSGLVWTATLL